MNWCKGIYNDAKPPIGCRIVIIRVRALCDLRNVRMHSVGIVMREPVLRLRRVCGRCFECAAARASVLRVLCAKRTHSCILQQNMQTCA